jgi:protein-S-isoprenylcysteine O-methyltransferase Ste14
MVPAAWLFYVAIVFEILYMISPYALYYYSVYGDWLNFLRGSRLTAWLTYFITPHFAHTRSMVLNTLPKLSEPLVLIGSLIFAVGFIQIYGAKLLRRGAVTGGLYRLIRHPQYVGLAVVGAGTLLHWPRFLVLVMFVTMLFLYYFMARWEEDRCLEKFGESYKRYLENTGRFFPGRSLRSVPPLLPEAGGKRFAAALTLYLVVVGLSVGAGYWLRDYSLACVSTTYSQDMAVMSPALLTAEEMTSALAVALDDPTVGEHLKQAGYGSGAKLLTYVVPLDWGLPDLPMESNSGGHFEPNEFDHGRFKLLFTRVRSYDREARESEIIKHAYGLDPIILVKVDRSRKEMTGIETPPAHVRWGDIPTPLF